MSNPFSSVGGQDADLDAPQGLFNELDRDSDIRFLASHQDTVLATYQEDHLESPDVAVELPTGTGKTLIGLLIGEWRRRTRGERVLYLCPTSQLARQAHRLATEKYGLDANLFTGSQTGYDPKELTEYRQADKIAITNYSSLFNINPGLTNPGFIILDDAHVAEGFIGGNWSVPISRRKDEGLYDALLDLFADALPDHYVETLRKGDVTGHRSAYELVHRPELLDRQKSLREILDARAEDASDEVHYGWKSLRGHLDACFVYLSPWSILIRPLTPPSLTHEHFAGANQRFYMSATLGGPGTLEKMVGVADIDRISTPSEYEIRGSGRRLFVFPDAAFREDTYLPWIQEKIEDFERALVLCRDYGTLSGIYGKFEDLDAPMFVADRTASLSRQLERFRDSDEGVLVAASRFDGIDLPGDDCRLIVMVGNPDAINLQERFQISRLGLVESLEDRITTRFTQAAGRCTRSDEDYAVVVPISDELLDFCTSPDRLSSLHPEMAAEVQFGIDESVADETEDLDERIEVFMEQGDAWDEVETHLRQEREEISEELTEYRGVPHGPEEVEFTYALWTGDREDAAHLAKTIADETTDQDLRLYRAWWSYLAGVVHLELSRGRDDGEGLEIAKGYLEQAHPAAGLREWYGGLTDVLEATGGETELEESHPADAGMVETVQDVLRELGLSSPKFEDHVAANEGRLKDTDSVAFEQGLEALGRYCGWEAQRHTGEGEPDVTWTVGDEICLVFEAKSEHGAGGEIGKKDCLQARGHYDWVGENLGKFNEVRAILVTPRMAVHETAEPHTDDLFHLTLEDCQMLFRDATETLRKVRGSLSGTEGEAPISRILDGYSSAGLQPRDTLERLTSREIATLDFRG